MARCERCLTTVVGGEPCGWCRFLWVLDRARRLHDELCLDMPNCSYITHDREDTTNATT